MVLMGRYPDAIRDYKAWLEKQPTPRFVDPCICMALLYEEMGEIPKAVQMREEQYRICKEEYHFDNREVYDGILQEITRLKAIKLKC